MGYNPNFRGSTANATSTSSRSLSTPYQNGSGGALAQCTPVAVNSFGQLINIDVSNSDHINLIVGVVGADIPNAATGPVFDGGRLEDVDLPAFSVGAPLWVAKDGFLTDVKPEIGVGGFVAGDSVIFIGMVVKNQFNPLLKDLKLLIDTKIGSL